MESVEANSWAAWQGVEENRGITIRFIEEPTFSCKNLVRMAWFHAIFSDFHINAVEMTWFYVFSNNFHLNAISLQNWTFVLSYILCYYSVVGLSIRLFREIIWEGKVMRSARASMISRYKKKIHTKQQTKWKYTPLISIINQPESEGWVS